MAKAKQLKLFFFESNDVKDTFPLTNIAKAKKLIRKGVDVCAFGNVTGTKGTTRTSRIKEIVFKDNNTHIVTQNSNYIVL